MANTHKVNTGGSILILRELFSSVKVEDYSQTLNAHVGDDTAFPDKTEFILLEEGLGYDCQWDRVRVGDKEGYFYNKYIEKLASTPDSLKYFCKKDSVKHFSTPINWVRQELNKAYLDRTTKEWCVPVETKFSSGGSDLKARLNLYVKPGLEIILKENGKSFDDETLNNILSKYITAKAKDYYIDPRPNAVMRVLITFPNKYIQYLANISTIAAYANITPSETIQLFASTFQSDVENAASTMEAYAAKIDKFIGTVENVDLRAEAKRLKIVTTKLSEILYYNSIETKEDTILELAIDQDGKCFVVSENSSGVYRVIHKGMDSFLNNEAFDSTRTMNYLAHLSEITESLKNRATWSEFLEKYTIAPKVVVYPSKQKGLSKSDITDNSIKDNLSSSGNTAADTLEDLTNNLLNSCSNPDVRLDFWAVKTAKDIERFTKMMRSDNKMKKIWEKIKEEADEAGDWIGSEVYRNLGIKLDKINNIDELFEQILDRICLTDLVIPALACFEVPSFTDEFKEYKDSLPGLPDFSLCADRCKITPTLSCSFFLDDLPTHDILAQLSKIIWDAILDMLNQMYLELMKDLIKLLNDICSGEEDEDENGAGHTILANVPDISNDLNNLLDDIASLLSPRELCNLLKGIASDPTIELIRSIIRRRHPRLDNNFNTKSGVIDFFMKMGNFVDTKFCDSLVTLPINKTPFLNCDTNVADPFAVSPNLYSTLADKKEITNEQIEEQLEKAKQRRKDKMDKLAEIMKMVSASQRGEENPFGQLVTTLLPISGAGGLVELSHPSYDFMQGVVLDTMFSTLRSSFNEDAKELRDSLIETISETSRIKMYLDLENLESHTHPEITGLTGTTGGSSIGPVHTHTFTVNSSGNGQTNRVNGHWHNIRNNVIETEKNKILNPEVRHSSNKTGILIEEYEKIADADSGFVKIQNVVKKVNKRLQFLLDGVESNDVFNYGADQEGFFYELSIPPPQSVFDIIANLQNNIDDFNFSVEDLSSAPRWRIRYKVPYIIKSTEEDRIDDDYIMEIFPSENSLVDGIRAQGRGNIDKKVITYINNTLIGKNSSLKAIHIPLAKDIKIEKTELPINYSSELNIPCLPKGVSEEEVERYTPPPQAVFGQYVYHRWREETNEENISLSGELGRQIKEYFSYDIFPEVSRDLISSIAKQVSESPLFDNIETKRPNESSSWNTNMAKLSFNRTPTKIEKSCNIDPHLMKIKYFKADIKNTISKIDQATTLSEMNTTGLPLQEVDSWSRAVMMTTVKMTVRGYIFDYAMRGMFSITEFSLKQSVDEFLVDFFLEKMISELKSYGTKYSNKFIDIGNDLYLQMIESGEIQAGSNTQTQKHQGLRVVIRNTIEEVYDDVKCIIDKGLDLNLNKLNHRSLKQRLVEEWLPVLDAKKSKNEPRFTNTGTGLTSISESLQSYFHDLPEKRRTLLAAIENSNKLKKEYDKAVKDLSEYKTARLKIIEESREVQYDVCVQQETDLRAAEHTDYGFEKGSEWPLSSVARSRSYEESAPAHPFFHAQHICSGFKEEVKSVGSPTPGNDFNLGGHYANKKILLPSPTPGTDPGNLIENQSKDVATRNRDRWHKYNRFRKYWDQDLKNDERFGGSVDIYGGKLTRCSPDIAWTECLGDKSWGKYHWSWRGDAWAEEQPTRYIDWKEQKNRYWKSRKDEYAAINEIAAREALVEKLTAGVTTAAQGVLDAKEAMDSIVFPSGIEADVKETTDITELLLDPKTGEYSGTVKQKFNVLSSVVVDGESVSFDLSNGNFFLERSLMFIPKDNLQKHINSLNITGLTNALRDTIKKQFDVSLKKHFKDTSGTFYTNPVIFSNFIKDFIKGVDKVDLKTWLAEAFFEDIRPVLRLIYIPAILSPEGDEKINNFSDIMEKAMTKDKFSREIKKAAEKTGIFYAEEHHDRDTFDIKSGKVVSNKVITKVYPISLIDTGKMNVDDCEYNGWKEASIDQYSMDNPDFVDRYKASVIEQRDKLVTSTEFKLLFDFVFPLDRYLSMVNIYSIITSSGTSKVNSAFIETKDSLQRIFGILSNTGYKQKIPDSPNDLIEDLSDKDGCFFFDDKPFTIDQLITGEFRNKLDIDFSDQENPFADKGIKWAEKHYENTKHIILEKVAKITDPNIIISSLIESTLKKYVPCAKRPSLYKISRSLYSPFWPHPPWWKGWNVAAILTPWGYAYLKGLPWPPEGYNFYSKKKKSKVDCEAEKNKSCIEKS